MEDTDDTSKAEKTNCELRKRYLFLMMKLQDKQCQVQCHEKTWLKGTFQTISPASDYIVLSEVTTGHDYMHQIALRQSDIVRLHWPNPFSSKN